MRAISLARADGGGVRQQPVPANTAIGHAR